MITIKHIRIFILLLFTISYFQPGKIFAQTNYPEIGKPFPGLDLTNIEHYKRRNATAEDLKGHFLILDFWNKYCSACIKNFPKTDKLYDKYKDKLSIILVGRDEEGIKPLYKRISEKQNLHLPFCFDSTLYNRVVFAGAPHLVWIDKGGIVKAITSSTALTDENIQAFIEDRKFAFQDRSFAAQQSRWTYNKSVPYLVDGNGGESANFLYRSLISEADVKTPVEALPVYIGDVRDGKYEGMTNLGELYLAAYFGAILLTPDTAMYGNYWHWPVLQVKDPSVFELNRITRKGFYFYSLMVPESKSEAGYLMNNIQSDLKRWFGYNVVIEDSMMPYWSLTRKGPGNDLEPDSLNVVFSFDRVRLAVNNLPMLEVLRLIFSYHQMGPPFVDETGIEGNISLDMEADFTKIDDLKRALNKKGLDLKLSKKMMKVLVIKDP